MAGKLEIKNGICICHARLALTTGVGKWVKGTVLELYPLGWEFNWGDMAHFLLVRLKLTQDQAAMVIDRKLKVPLDSFLSLASVEKYEANLSKKEAEFLSDGERPKLDREVDGETFGAITPEKQWFRLPTDEDLTDPRVVDGIL